MNPTHLSAAPSSLAALLRRWRRPAIAAAVGGVGFLGLSHLMASAGGTCMILCNPWVAVPYGALLGVLAAAGPARATMTTTPPPLTLASQERP